MSMVVATCSRRSWIARSEEGVNEVLAPIDEAHDTGPDDGDLLLATLYDAEEHARLFARSWRLLDAFISLQIILGRVPGNRSPPPIRYWIFPGYGYGRCARSLLGM